MQKINYKKLIRIVMLMGIPFFATAQTSPRERINFDEDWKFHFGHGANPEKDFNYSIATIFSKSGGAAGTAIDPRFRDSSWRTLNLPHDSLNTWEAVFDRDGKSN